MSDRRPAVSIGVPVYNAERYLEEALDSLLSQTFEDFELIVSDNASTDGTPAICDAYERRDERVRCVRHETNLGAAWNHSFVAREARAPLFKWAAADDLCAPEFLQRCVEALEHDASAVLCQPQTLEIDEQGVPIGPYRHELRVESGHMLDRWTDLLMIGYSCYHVYGVIRADALRATGLMGSYVESDMVLLAELSLQGRFAEVDDELFLHRLHPGQSVAVHESIYERGGWFDTRKAGRPVFPTWRFAGEYLRALARAPIGRRARLACLAALGRWARARRRSLARDLKAAASAWR